MDFETFNGVYGHFLNKKEQMEEALFVVETEKQNFVANQKLVAMMLVCPMSPDEIMSSNLADAFDQTTNLSSKTTTYLSLNKSGDSFYDTMDVEKRSPAFFAALFELNNEESSRALKRERKIITSFCLKHGIKNIEKTTKSEPKIISKETPNF